MGGCNKEANLGVDDEIIKQQESRANTGGKLIIGEKLENPYSIDNMRKALDYIFNETKESSDYNTKELAKKAETIDLRTTDLYIRFLPKDSTEYDLLKKDTVLSLYDYPLDFKIEKQGEYYHDPSLSENQITWQYAVVKPNYSFSSIKYEILSELFIPENSEGYHEKELLNKAQSKTSTLNVIETVSLFLTNNLSKEEKEHIEEQQSNFYKRVCVWFICWNEPDPWYPSGRIEIEDTELGTQPVEGVKVRARRWFTIKTTTTNSKGDFKLGYFKRDVNYSLIWETYHFSIRQKWLWFIPRQAWMNGPKRRSKWNVKLNKHSENWFHGTIFQAAHHYYYKNIKGLKRPPLNSFWKPQMKIRSYFENNNDANGSYVKDIRLFGIIAPIRIYNPNNSSLNVYATTIHELAHGSHWELRKNKWNFNQTSDKVIESWARGVQWELTRMKYPGYKGGGFSTGYYTLVVADMIDGVGYNDANYGFYNSNDEVYGYTIKQIEDVLSYTSSWNNWRVNIKNRYNNPTKNNLSKLFRAYE